MTAAPAAPATIAQRSVDTIRALSMDAVERAGSGHPGAPMGLAPVAYLLWSKILRHDPADPAWPDRDRVVLSCGHASMLLYSILHLTGYDLELDELRQFRQLGSRTPGHPERGRTPGVEVTTGPLGQGIGNAVGMAIAERYLGERYNRPHHAVIDHRTWALCSDGDLMEGVASEAASLAGHLRLGKLALIYDDNRISIEGSTSLTFTEDVARRFEAYGWRVVRVADGNDLDSLTTALESTRKEVERPTLVIVRTHIGYPSPGKQDSADAHGSPLGAEEVRATKRAMEWPEDAEFLVPDEVRRGLAGVREAGAEKHLQWQRRRQAHRLAHPELAAELDRVISGELPAGWDAALPAFDPAKGGLATRQASGKVLNVLAARLPELIGGSADLGPSNNSRLEGEHDFTADRAGRILHFGVREHAMGACLNGMAAHGGVRPFGATFLVFADYMRPAIRMAALMELPVIYVFTHDSIGLGEDGPTHQPVEHLAALRAIPNLLVLRPGDAAETTEAWKAAVERRGGPTALVLTRQKVPVLDRARFAAAEGVHRGAYVLADSSEARAILIATGSELGLAVEARLRLAAQGMPVRVVSMPSWELFEAQDLAYRESVLPTCMRKRLSIEAGCSQGWLRYVTESGASLSLDRFGASAPADDLFRTFGFTVDRIVEQVRAMTGGEAR